MADAKSLLESIARSFGYIYGREKNVRINTISQSPTETTAGKGIKDIDNMMDFADKMSPLRKWPSASSALVTLSAYAASGLAFLLADRPNMIGGERKRQAWRSNTAAMP